MILQTFKKIAQRAAELYAIQLFLHLLLNLHCPRHNDAVPSILFLPNLTNVCNELVAGARRDGVPDAGTASERSADGFRGQSWQHGDRLVFAGLHVPRSQPH